MRCRLTTRDDIVNRLKAAEPQMASSKARWLRDHEADVLALLEHETLRGAADVIGYSYATVAQWKRFDAEAPSRAGLSDPDPHPNYGADTNATTMAAMGHEATVTRAHADNGVPVDDEGEMLPDVAPLENAWEQVIETDQADGTSPGLEEKDEAVPMFQCPDCDVAPFVKKAGLGSHRYHLHGVTRQLVRLPRTPRATGGETTSVFEDAQYWQGRHDGLLEGLLEGIKLVWEMLGNDVS